jgi:hypothetical protein
VNTEEFVRRLPARPGYRLADDVEVGLPVYLITARVFTQVQKKLTPIDEFLLRLTRAGLQQTEEMATFLGLQPSLVDDALSNLLAEDLLTPVTLDRKQRFGLTLKGLRSLEAAETLTTEEKTLIIEYDAICRRVVMYGKDRLVSGRQARRMGLKQIRPLINRQLDISDLPLRDVQRTIELNTLRREMKRAVLAIKELYRRHLYFLPGVALIYCSKDGAQIDVSFLVDGSISSEHDQSFARIDGVRRLGIDRDLSRFQEQKEDFGRIVEAIKAAQVQPAIIPPNLTTGSQIQDHSVLDLLRHLTLEQRADLERHSIAYLAVEDHPSLLAQALKTSRQRLMIICPFLHESIVTDEFLRELESLLYRGVRVYIGYGMPDSVSRSPSKSHTSTVEKLDRMAQSSGQLNVRRVDSHAKVLIQDARLLVVGSFNWLSFKGDPDRPFRDEQSVLISLPSMIEKKFQELLPQFTQN